MPDILGLITADHERLLTVAAASDNTARDLRAALAELHTLAGWCAHDMHILDAARWHYHRATTLAGEAEHLAEIVSATWHAAIMERDAGHPDDALKLLQLAQARSTGIIPPGMTVTLCVASAWALSLMGQQDEAARKLSQSLDYEPPADPFDRAGMDNARAQT